MLGFEKDFVRIAQMGGDAAFDAAELARGHGADVLAPVLARLLEHANGRVRFAAALAVGEQGVVGAFAALVPLIHDRNIDVRLEAVASLGRLRVPEACQPLLNLMSKIDMRDAAARALGELGAEDAIPALAAAAVGPSDQVRITAIEALGKIGTPAAIQSAACALDDDAEPVIGEAARVIGRHRFAPAVPKLLALLASLPKWSLTRGWCAEALGEIGDASAVEPLITVIRDTGLLSVHSFAASALGKLRDPRALQPLEELLASRDPDARAAAEAALTELRALPGAAIRGPAERVL